MQNVSPTAAVPFLRSCKQESDAPIGGEVQGHIPKWLKGNLIRVGPGLLEVGPDKYSHVFDGLALMHRFSFEDGDVQYQSRFLRSDTYKKNMAANRILQSEFGTHGAPDPCQSIFQRLASRFSREEFTDNDLVNIVMYTDEAYACSETNFIWRIDPDSLESLEKESVSKYVPVDAAIAHAHEDTDGTVYNIGSNYGYNCSYTIMKFPPKANPKDSAFKGASEICRIPSSKKMTLSYHHSFAMTENFFVFVEQPMHMSVPRLAWAHFVNKTAFSDALQWDREQQCKLHVVNRSDGSRYHVQYKSTGFFVFHHINAYEEDDHIVVDVCSYDNGDVVKSLYVKSLVETVKNTNQTHLPFQTRAKRFVLPLKVDSGKRGDENLITLKNTETTAYRQADGSIFLNPEVLTGYECWCPELPRIHYEKYNGRKYKYFYAVAKKDAREMTNLIKVNTETRDTTSWGEEGVMPSEPVFISNPDSEEGDEDSGVLVASLLYVTDETKVAMLVLDAKTMTEIGRVTFQTKSSVPGDFHGIFIGKD